MKTHLNSALFVWFICFVTAPAAQEFDEAWILYEKGHIEYAKREYGEALRLFKVALEKAGIFPEAEVAIGDVFWQSGEATLAEEQYWKAYELRNSFYIQEDKYIVLYKLAYLYRAIEKYKKMEETFLLILDDDPYYADSAKSNIRYVILDMYFETGFDHLTRLYRFTESSSLMAVTAYAELGWFYYRTGRYALSITDLLFAILPVISESVNELRRYDPDYEYTSLPDFIEKAFFRDNIRRYLVESQIFENLYYLASSTYASGYPESAVALWRHIAASPYSGKYGSLSERQARAPWIEPYLVPTD